MAELRAARLQLEAGEAAKKRALAAMRRQQQRDLYEFVVVVSVVVPDTNCLLNSNRLALLVELARQSSGVQICVPTMVICELQSMKTDKHKHAGSKKLKATAALDFILNSLDDWSVTAVTEDGRRVLPSRLRAKDWPRNPHGRNDDVILEAAYQLSHTLEHTTIVQGERFTIKPVVLFTDDRNMRSRALTSRLPVCDTTGLSLLLGHGIDEEVELDSEAATGPP